MKLISFAKFRQFFVKDPNRKKMDLINKVGLHPKTAGKVWKDENTTLKTVDMLCRFYGLKVEEVIEFIDEEEENG